MKTQTLKGTTVLVGLAMAVVLAALGCRETMYPFARAFGSPPESELAQCREAFRLLQSCLATGRVQVQPVLFIEDGRRQWRHDLAQAIVTLPDGRIVAARQGRLLATSFHPELTDDTRCHAAFLTLAS